MQFTHFLQAPLTSPPTRSEVGTHLFRQRPWDYLDFPYHTFILILNSCVFFFTAWFKVTPVSSESGHAFLYLIKERLGCLNDLCCLAFPSFWKVLPSNGPPLSSSAVCVSPLLTILHTPVPVLLFSSTQLSLSSLHTTLHMCSWGWWTSFPGSSP